MPERPWQKVGCDIFTLDEKDFLCTVDYYTGYFEVDHLERKTARSIITRLKRHFSNHGIPNLFQSDNGPPFDSQEFRDFAAAYEFEVVTSSPNYPQSNGRVENAVKTAKQLMKKSKQAGTDFYFAGLDKYPDGGRRLFTRAKTFWPKDKNTSSNSNKSFETYDSLWCARETS